MKMMRPSCLKSLLKAIMLTAVATAFLCAISHPLPSFGASKGVAVDFTSVAKKAIPAVVSIRTKAVQQSSSTPFQFVDPFGDDLFGLFFGRPKLRDLTPKDLPQQQGIASGFIVSPDGYVLTNSHVVSGAQEILVKLSDGREFQAKLIGQDPKTDVAVVKIDATKLPYLTFGNSADLQVGQWVAAVGNPLGLQESMTVGIISAKGRANLDVADLEDFIQTDAAINRGNSGGPLLNLDGEVIGMNTAIASSSGGSMGIGFAIPSDMTKRIMDEIIKSGNVTRGFLGIVLQPIDYDLAMAFGLNQVEGALVAEVQEGSPAENAGIKRGDIILEKDGRIIDSVPALRNAISLTSPGDKITLKVLRDGKPVTLNASVGKFSDSKEGKIEESKSILGIRVSDLSPEDARRLGLPQGQQGVLITSVEPNSVAATIGLKKDAVVLEVNRQKVTSAEQFHKLVGALTPDSRLLLLVRQGDVTAYLVMTMQ